MKRRPEIAAAALTCALALIVGAAVAAGDRKIPAAADCDGAVITDVRDGVLVCIHASERPPPGVDLDHRPDLDELRQRRYGPKEKPPSVAGTDQGTAYSAAGTSVACIGDGTTGNRVQAIYARAADVPDRYGSVVGLIRQYAADADYQVNVSAGQSGVGRRVRYVTASCSLSVASVVLSSAGDDSFTAMRSELRAKGFNRSDRKYLVWADASVGICGLGELYNDDRPTPDNYNNGGPAYARVDAPCWGYAEAHELLHTLGAVQSSAPNSTSAGHCVDENDTMCYVDTSGTSMLSSCPGFPSWQVDCSLDDYFNADADPSGYLSTHWNVADSSFLEGAPAPPAPPSIAASVPGTFYAGNGVRVTAAVTVPAGRTFTVSWSSSRTDCKFFAATGVANTFYCPVTSAGSGQVTARVTDSLGMSSSATRNFKLTIPSRRRATIASLGRSPRTIRRGQAARLNGRLVDANTGKAVIGMRVSVYYRKAGTTTWRLAATKTTGKDGALTMSVEPSRSTYYRIVSWYTKTWASDQSPSRKVGVI